jgi:hypothetical protein
MTSFKTVGDPNSPELMAFSGQDIRGGHSADGPIGLGDGGAGGVKIGSGQGFVPGFYDVADGEKEKVTRR